MLLEGKTAVVTECGRGIGRAILEELKWNCLIKNGCQGAAKCYEYLKW